MKICSKCGMEKNESEFSKRKDSKDGYRNQCKQCFKQIQQKYQEENKELIKLQRKLYKKNNAEKIRIKNKEYRKNNRNYISNWHKENRRKNAIAISAQKKEYCNQIAKYETYKDKLTADESPKLSDDGISLKVKCRYCGKYFKPTNLAIKYRIRALNWRDKGDCFLYCSENCKLACPTYKQRVYPKDFKKASSREVSTEIRKLCFERDSWSCQKCGKTVYEIELHCHHIKSYTQNKIFGNDIDNCITLCKECHKEVHKQDGCKYHELRCKD